MKIRIFESIFLIALLFVTLYNMVTFAIDSFSYNLDELPPGRHTDTLPSPDGDKILDLYLIEIEDVGTGIKGVVTDNATGDQKVICWKTDSRVQSVEWLNPQTVVINEQEINITGEPYDSRSQIELPEASAKSRALEQQP